MSKCLTIVAFALLVLSGAMGLRNIAVTHAATSDNSTFTIQGRPFPPIGGGGGGHMQGRPFPPIGGGGGGH
jgi:hypothetical protein